MESLKKIIDLGRQHYDKLILSLVLVGVAVAVFYLYQQSEKEKEKIEDYFRTKVQQKVKPVQVVALTNFVAAQQQLQNPPEINLATPHNLFNPVKWQKRPDGTMFKIQTGREVGPNALKIVAIRPLYLTIAVERAAGSGFWMVVTNEMVPRRAPGHRIPQFASLTTTNTQIFVLSEFRPEDNPTEWVVELRASGEKVRLTKEEPFRQVVGHEADLSYEVDGKTYNEVRVGRRIRLSGEDYNIVAINAKEVLLSAVSNDRRFAIQFTGAP